MRKPEGVVYGLVGQIHEERVLVSRRLLLQNLMSGQAGKRGASGGDIGDGKQSI